VVFFDSASGTAATVSVAATASCGTCTVNKSDIILSLTGSPTFTSVLTLTSGMIALNSYTFTVAIFSSNNTNARAVDFGTGKFVITANNNTIWQVTDLTGMTISGTPVTEFTYSGGTGTRSIRHGFTGGIETKSLSINVTGGSDIFDFYGAFRNVSFTTFLGTIPNNVRTIYGNLTLSAGMTFSGSLTTTFGSTSSQAINTNGVTLDIPVIFNGVGGTFTFQGNTAFGSTRSLTLTNGTLNAGTWNISIGSFALGSGTKTLTIGSGTWTVAAANWNANTNVANLTVSPSAGVISMTSASAKTFSGGGLSWPTLRQGGAGALTIQQSNSFANITNSVQPATITLTAGTTQTVAAFGVSGTAGNLITLNSSTAGTRATLSDSVGTVEVSNVSIKDINATGGATWNAFLKSGNVDAGNNSGWDFFQSVGQVFSQVFNSIFRPVFQ
jgi:hypothetical protein